jgi:hypothetical protein
MSFSFRFLVAQFNFNNPFRYHWVDAALRMMLLAANRGFKAIAWPDTCRALSEKRNCYTDSINPR